MKYQLYDKLEIHCYKHNGKINSISDGAIILDETKEYLVCANYHAKLTDNDGSFHVTREPAIIFFYKKNWFNVIAQFKSCGLCYYCNIASPYLIDGKTIKYIDYDLDLRVFPDGSYKVLDKGEYEYHKRIMKYPDEINFIIEKELTYLINLKKMNYGPFDKNVVNNYLKKFNEINHRNKEI